MVASLVRASREPWGRDWAPRTPEAAAKRWLECVEAAERSGTALGAARFLRVRYEALHAAPSRELARVLGFLGLEAGDAEVARMIGASESIGSDEATGRLRLRGELRDRPSLEPAGFVGEGRIDGWKGTLGWAGERRVWSITKEAMERLGYTRDGWRRGQPSA